ITAVSPAVAKAAIASGVARRTISDWDAYAESLELRLGLDHSLIRSITTKAKSNPKRVVFAEADHYKILKAAQIVRDEGIAMPILLGNRERILKIIEETAIGLDGVQIIDPSEDTTKLEEFAEFLYRKRQRRGMNLYQARKL